MKNIWLLISLFLSVGAICIYYLESPFMILIFLFPFLWIARKKNHFIGLLFLLLILFLSLCRGQRIYQNFNQWIEPRRVEGYGIVTEKKDSYLIVSRANLRDKPGSYKVYLYTDKDTALGQEVVFKGKSLKKQDSMNPGSFNEKLYDLASSIDIRLDVNKLEETGRYSYLYRFKANIRKNFLTILDRNLMEKSGEIVSAIILGEEVDQSLMKTFQDVGMVHILSISGLHIGIILFIIEKTLKIFKVGFYKKKAIKHFLVWAYMFLVGFPIGALRVYTMLLFVEIGKMLRRPVEPNYSLFFASSLFLLLNPFLIFQYSFLFTFFSVFGIYNMYPILKDMIPLRNKFFKESVSLSISVNLAILPLLLNLQGRISIIGILLNIFLIPVFSLVIYLALLILIIGGVFLFIGPILGQVVDGLLYLCLILIDYGASSPFYINLRPFSPMEAGLYFLSLAFFFSGRYRDFDHRQAKIIICQGAFSIFILIFLFYLQRPDAKITQIYVGQGDAALVETRHHNFLIDTGGSVFSDDPGSKYTLTFLRSQGIHKLDGLFISHFDADHIEGVFSLSPEIKIREIYSSYVPNDREIYDRINSEIAPIVTIQNLKKDVDGLMLYLMSLNESNRDENANSMITMLANEHYKILYTGDLPVKEEEKLANILPEIDVLKLSHHGSNTSSSDKYLKDLNPQVALISVGIDNSYGHPHKEVLDRLKQGNIKTFRTDRDGAIQIKIKDNRMYVETQLGREKISNKNLFFIGLYFFTIVALSYVMIFYIKAGDSNEHKRIL